jgi:predicted GNAT superfamily acetyltransferase
MNYTLQILEQPEELAAVETLQRVVWPGSETEVVPVHMLRASIHHGGLAIGAFALNQPNPTPENAASERGELAGFVFGFPGTYPTPDGPRLMHCSHMLGVHPQHRQRGLGYLLKRAQWQMVRRQGIDRITWTYDPLLSVNARLNITRLGAVCNTYLEDFYGSLQDTLNAGLPTDRFQLDWWVNSRRVNHRLSKRSRPQLSLEQYMAAEPVLLNETTILPDGSRLPTGIQQPIPAGGEALLLVEIPADFQRMRSATPELAQEWRVHIRRIFQAAFQAGYLVTDFVFERAAEDPNAPRRCFYILSYGDSTL